MDRDSVSKGGPVSDSMGLTTNRIADCTGFDRCDILVCGQHVWIDLVSSILRESESTQNEPTSGNPVRFASEMSAATHFRTLPPDSGWIDRFSVNAGKRMGGRRVIGRRFF